MNETKQIIIKKAAELFNQVGIRSCSIDDICRELGISKKTFYQYFATKDELVESMLHEHEIRVETTASKDEQGGVPAMDVMLHFLEAAEKMRDVRKVPVLMYDLKKYYPVQYEAHTGKLALITKEYLTRLLQRGINEGDFRDDLDAGLCGELFSLLHQQSMNNITRLSQLDNFAQLNVFTVDLLIRGIVSEQGAEKLKEKDEKSR